MNMQNNIVFETKAYQRVFEACERAKTLNMISIVVGPTGIGRSTALHSYALSCENVFLTTNTVDKSSNLNADLVIVDDFCSMPLVKWKWVYDLVNNHLGTGVVLSMSYEDYLKHSERVLSLAACRMEMRSLRQSLNLVDRRMPILVKGSKLLVAADDSFRSKFIISGDQRNRVNALYFLRRPSISDVEAFCFHYGLTSGIHELYQKGSNVNQIINAIIWKKQHQPR